MKILFVIKIILICITLSYSIKRKFKHTSEKPIIEIKADLLKIKEDKYNYTISWSVAPTSISDTSWIGIYPYAKTTQGNNINSCDVHNENGNCSIEMPNYAGIFSIRYVYDNFYYLTGANIEPIVFNLEGYSLKVDSSEIGLNSDVKISWKVRELARDAKLCLNVIGLYDECIWSKEIENSEGNIVTQVPDKAGYYVYRIIKNIEDYQREEESSIVVSEIIKVTDNNTILKNNKFSVIGSTIEVEWDVKEIGDDDIIGAFSIENSEISIRSSKALKHKKIRKNKGKFQLFMKANNPSGSYFFVYFKNSKPIAISDRIILESPKVKCPKDNKTMSNIKHLVIICSENHSFDSYFGEYCIGDKEESCNYGRECCVKAPTMVNNHKVIKLDNDQNMKYDPSHEPDCQSCEINKGKMDKFSEGCECSNEDNYAIAPYNQELSLLHKYASTYALADRFFQPSLGTSQQNNMYLTRASYVYRNNSKLPTSLIGTNCGHINHFSPKEFETYYDPTISNILSKCGFVLKSYPEGYNSAIDDYKNNKCNHEGYEAADIPYDYYFGISNNKKYIGDYDELLNDLNKGTLSDIAFVKPLWINSGHPTSGTLTQEMDFINKTVEAIFNSKYYEDTLIVYVTDEAGGYYDHIPPPKTNDVDKMPYGPRIPFLALGKFAKKNYISHVQMEHSSIIKFIEWNWLSGKTGQLNTRDRNVNSIGDLIDPEMAGIEIPN